MDRKKCPFCGRFAPRNKECYCFVEEEEDDGCFTTNLEKSENAAQKSMKPDCSSLDSSTVNFKYSNLAFPQIDNKEFLESVRAAR
ncbi:hypothetical protein AVEN_68066-1, partial [Araneus ventricosus]